MTILITGLLLFIATHLIREFRLRDRLLIILGTATYKILFSLASVLGLALIIWGKSQAPFVMLWQPVYEYRQISHFLMLPAMILFTAGNLPHSHIRYAIGHPMLLGTGVWGVAHLWANGDLASLLLFGSLTLWALIKFTSLSLVKLRNQNKPGYVWDLIAVIAGFFFYGLIMVYHGQLFGVGLTIA